MKRRAVGWLLFAIALAGCLQPAAPGPAADVAKAPVDWDALGALVFSKDHDHRDRALHTEVKQNLEVVNFTTLTSDGKSLGEYTEADYQRGLVAVATTSGLGSTVTVDILDANALPATKVVSHFVEPNAYGDVKLDRTLPLVYVPFPSNKAFAIWDISNLAAPKRVGEAQGYGCHMLNTLPGANPPIVFCAGVGGTYLYRVQAVPGQGYVGVPMGLAFPQSDLETTRYTTYYQPISPLGPALITTPHDQTGQLDPITKAPLLVTAHELQGIRVYDMAVPGAPREISEWRGDDLGHPIERIHTVGLASVAGKRIGVGVCETFDKVRPVLYIVDFTDYARPRLLAEWHPPGVLDDEGITYSLHNFQIVGDRMYVTNFHAGLWVLDISDPAHPRVEALRTPVRDTEYPYPGQAILPGVYNDMNMFWDVIVVRGYVIATDMAAGIEVIHVDGDPVGDAGGFGFT